MENNTNNTTDLYYRRLVQRYAQGQATGPELEAFFHLLAEGKLEGYLIENMNQFAGITDAPVISIKRNRWKKWAVAASILIVVITIGALVGVFTNNKGGEPPVVKTNDVQAPDKTKATITLADGRVITLDSLKTINQNGIELIKTDDGRLVYNHVIPNGSEGSVVLNTLSNPRGSKVIDMQLSDGSHVWLNAGSSVTYPIAFIGNERKVSITGEAYFEIAPAFRLGTKEKKSFVVSKGDMSVTVLGTKFNVNAYDDEADIKVTLLEGSVKTSIVNGESSMLMPGQQARIQNQESRITVSSNVDIEQIMAWKNGLFSFNRADIKTIMRQLARWYDLEVEYQGQIPNREFSGEMQRDLPLSGMMRLLEKGKINLKLEGRKLIVL